MSRAGLLAWWAERYPSFPLDGSDAIACQGGLHDPVCACGGALALHQAGLWENMERVQRLRVFLGQPLRIGSLFRCADWNAHVGGWSQSQHLKAEAIDLHLDRVRADRVRYTENPVPESMKVGEATYRLLDVDNDGFLTLGSALYLAMKVGGGPKAKLYSWGAHLATFGSAGGARVQVDRSVDDPPAWIAVADEVLA
ncbi:MAG: D-Ala-D-Ala carboxypeptidase family metallohydrolase [Rhodospirillaceae bacterium]